MYVYMYTYTGKITITDIYTQSTYVLNVILATYI